MYREENIVNTAQKAVTIIIISLLLLTCCVGQKDQKGVMTGQNDRTENDAVGKYYQAVYEGDIAAVKESLKKGITVDELLGTDKEVDDTTKDYTALMIAAENGNAEIAKVLINAGANVNARGYGGITPLMIASGLGTTGVMEVLLQSGADISVKDETGSHALGMAAEKGQSEAVKMLIAHGAVVDAIQGNGATSIMIAAQNGHLDVVRVLLGAHAKIDVIAKENDVTTLMIAATKGYLEIAKLLIQNGADVNQKNKDGVTALAPAVQENQLEIVNLLIDKGVKVNDEYYNSTTRQYDTPLMIASWNGSNAVIDILIKHDAIVNYKTKGDGLFALAIAAQRGFVDTVELLLSKNANIDQKNTLGATALILAASENHPDIVKLLLDNGAKYEYVTTNGLIPLFTAVDGNSYDSVKYLLEAGANPNIKAKLDGKTCTNLAYARERGFDDIAELLLKYGAKE